MTGTPAIGSTFFGLDISGLISSFHGIGRRMSRSTLLIEFAPRMLQLAEVRQRSHGIEIKHLSRIALPEEALDRNVPADPLAMAQLLEDLCREKGIVSHRAAVVLPPEVAFQRLIHLPNGLTSQDARNFLMDPQNGVQLPFPLAQTDFDLIPMSLHGLTELELDKSAYQLVAVPDSLVEPIIGMLNASGFDLQSLELGNFAALRCLSDELTHLKDTDFCLVCDFSPEATLVTIVGCSGPIDAERLPAIREFPRFELTDSDSVQVVEGSKSLEEVTIENDRYLHVSEMDLRAFHDSLDYVLARFGQRFPGLSLNQAYVTGDGSSHPRLTSLLQEKLGCPVQAIRPFLSAGLRDCSLDEPLTQSSLSRLIGLGLGLGNPSDHHFNSVPNSSSLQPVLDADIVLVPDTFEEISADADASAGVVAEPVDVVEAEGSAELEESEWPSLKLTVSEETFADADASAGVVAEPVDVVEDEGSVEFEESEWPSLKLTVSEETFSDADDSAGVVAEPVDGALEQHSEGMKDEEDNWRFLPSSPILPNQTLKQSTQTDDLRNAKVKQALGGTDSDLSDSERPLGELRFQDD